jgi:predicted acylesterase/phospholipase RssA
MPRRTGRYVQAGALALGLLCAATLGGCRLAGTRSSKAACPPVDLVDRDLPADSINPLDPDELKRVADLTRHTGEQRTPPSRRYNILVLSGGGMFGAFSAGVLAGWTEAGDRPTFDVVTGVSTGALIAPLAFLGPAYDQELRRHYTTVSDQDILRRRGLIHALCGESLADNAPLAKRIRSVCTPELLREVAAEHYKGRRLYVATTNLTTKRLVVWDLGAIAARGTPEARDLFCDVLLASAAVPGFVRPVRFRIDVDGLGYEEIHVDGGMVRSMFFRAPYFPPEERAAFERNGLAGSNVYVVVAGKVYADPQEPRPRTLSIASHAITSMLYALTRGDLDRLFHLCLLTGMNYHVAAIPQDFQTPTQRLRFDPAVMTRLFEEGRREALARAVWRERPPGLDKREEVRSRSGLWLSVCP